MDFHSTDRYMSSWLIVCVKDGTMLFLTFDGKASDILDEAFVCRRYDQAEEVAESAKLERPWSGFDWHPLMVPEALSRKS